MKRTERADMWIWRLPTGMAILSHGTLTTHAQVRGTETPTRLPSATDGSGLFPHARTRRSTTRRSLWLLWVLCAVFAFVTAGTIYAREYEGSRANSVLLNGQWEFATGTGDEGVETAAGEQKLSWRRVTLPGPFMAWNREAANQTKFVWARRGFNVTPTQAQGLAVLRWNRIASGAAAFIKGQKVGENEPTGPFQVIVPAGVLRPGENQIVLKIRGAAGVRRSRSGNPLIPAGFGPGAPEVTDDVWLDFADTAYMKWVLALPDVADKADHCVVVKASYVILRGLTLQNARIHAVLLGDGVHDVVIEGCDISGWGRVDKDGWGVDYDSAVYSKYEPLTRVIIQRNHMHHPRSNANCWQEFREGGERYHPKGPQGISFFESAGNHVFRYNDFMTDDHHYCNDIFGGGANRSLRGFPGTDSDVYGNHIEGCWDDGLELEGGGCNVRV